MYYILTLELEDQLCAYCAPYLYLDGITTRGDSMAYEFMDTSKPYPIRDLEFIATFVNYTGGMSSEVYEGN